MYLSMDTNLVPPQKNFSGANALAHQHVLRFIVLEVKMPFSCFPKAKAIQSRVRKQNNCPTNGTGIVCVDLLGQYKT